MANLQLPTEKVTFDLDIEDEYIHLDFQGPHKYRLSVTFSTRESGNATNVNYKVFNSSAIVFKWDAKLFNYIQIAAEAHSIIHWRNIEASIKQDQQLLN